MKSLAVLLIIFLGLEIIAAVIVVGTIPTAIWLLLGMFCDKVCENEAKKRQDPYPASMQLVSYIMGPAVLAVTILVKTWKAFCRKIY